MLQRKSDPPTIWLSVVGNRWHQDGSNDCNTRHSVGRKSSRSWGGGDRNHSLEHGRRIGPILRQLKAEITSIWKQHNFISQMIQLDLPFLFTRMKFLLLQILLVQFSPNSQLEHWAEPLSSSQNCQIVFGILIRKWILKLMMVAKQDFQVWSFGVSTQFMVHWKDWIDSMDKVNGDQRNWCCCFLMQVKVARAMRKQWFIWVGLVPTIELCRAGAYGRILTDGCRACTLMTGARSNPPYIHLHLSSSGIITWGLLHKERMGRFGLRRIWFHLVAFEIPPFRMVALRCGTEASAQLP